MKQTIHQQKPVQDQTNAMPDNKQIIKPKQLIRCNYMCVCVARAFFPGRYPMISKRYRRLVTTLFRPQPGKKPGATLVRERTTANAYGKELKMIALRLSYLTHRDSVAYSLHAPRSELCTFGGVQFVDAFCARATHHPKRFHKRRTHQPPPPATQKSSQFCKHTTNMHRQT